VLISYIKGLLASSWLGKLMPLINIPSKSARRGTREPELHSAKAGGGTRRRRGGSRRNIIGTTLSPLSAETEQEPRGILHFALPPSLRLVPGVPRVRPSRGGSRSALSILISARGPVRDARETARSRVRRRIARHAKARDLIKPNRFRRERSGRVREKPIMLGYELGKRADAADLMNF